MKPSVKNILNYRKTYYSQNGEDGLLEYIFEKIPDKFGWCVEVGAWDGKTFSNTYHFVSSHNFKGVMIESDPAFFLKMYNNMKNFSDCFLINQMVSIKGDKSLDNILKETPLPYNFDILSIDIDGDDYQVWQSLENYHPNIVIIEINLLDDPDKIRISSPETPKIYIEHQQWRGLWGEGSSLLSMTSLANEKGYELIAQVGPNAIFVLKKYLKLFYDEPVSPQDVFTYEGHELYNYFLELTKKAKK